MKTREPYSDHFQQLLIACADLPFIRTKRGKTDYVVDLLQTVLDFHMQSNVVINAIDYFLEHVQDQHNIFTHFQLETLLAAYPNTEDGNRTASQFLWNNSHWLRVEYLRHLLTFLAAGGITDQVALHAWAQQADFERDFKGKVKGLGIAVFHWLLIRCGTDTIKPDVWVISFVKRVVGKRLSEKALIAAFGEIAPLLGESLETIDTTIWYYEKMAMATKDVPALRIVFWHLLTQELVARLNSQDASRWSFTLDDRARLRYDQASLTLIPNFAFFGTTFPGRASVVIRQAQWNHRFELELRVVHESELNYMAVCQLTKRLSTLLLVTHTPTAFEATLDLDESLMMSPTTTIESIHQRVTEIVARAVEAIRACST